MTIPAGQPCRATSRRQFMWQMGNGFAGTALAGLLGGDFFAKQLLGADGVTPFKNPLAA